MEHEKIKFWIAVLVTLIAILVLYWQKKRQPARLPDHLNEADAALALKSLEAAAPHLFQLRKYGVRVICPESVRESVCQVDHIRALSALGRIDGEKITI